MSEVSFLVGLIGSTVRRTWLQNMRMVRTDDNGFLQVVAPPGAPMNINIDQVEGAHLPGSGVAGILSVGGDVADGGAVSALFPVKIGAVVDLVLTAVADARVVNLITDAYRRLYVNPQGGVADDAVDDGTNPVKIGAVVDMVPASASADGDRVQLITDLERFLRVVSRCYDSVAAADRCSVNTIADDRDASAQVWAAETNTGAGTNYYPSAAGYEVGNRDHLTLQLVMVDTTTTFQVSNDGTTWIDITMSAIDLGTGVDLNASFATGAGASVNWMVEFERLNARYMRCAVVTVDATNTTSIQVMTRKA